MAMKKFYYILKNKVVRMQKQMFALLFFCAMSFLPMALNAQTNVTIGTGTTTASHPLPGLWGYQYDVYLYDATDITAQGYITKIAYNIYSATTNSNNSQIQIYMKDVPSTYTLAAATTFAGYTSGATLVYSSTSYGNPSTGWNTFNLNTNFCHELGNSLLVAVRTVGCTTSGGCSKSVYCTGNKTNKWWYKHVDSTDPGTAVSGTVSSTLPNIILTFNGSCGCTDPSGTFALSSTSGTLLVNTTLNLSSLLTNTLTPSAGSISYSSSNTSVATVSTSGVVAAQAEGSTTITVLFTPSNSNYCPRIVTYNLSVNDGCPNIGTGTSCSYTYGPANNFYKYGYYQYIYPLSTYSQSGEITSIGINYCYTTAMTDKTDVDIYMGLTSNATFASTTDWIPLSELTLVYSGPLNCTAQGWNSFVLDNPFYYDDSQYLVVAIDDNSNAYDGSSYTYTYTAGTGNSTLYYYSDSSNPDPSSPPTGYLSVNIPNMKFCVDENCTSPNGELSLSQNVFPLLIGETINLGTYLTNTLSPAGTITYTSGNPSVATVSSTGVVTGIANGSARITIKYNSPNGTYCSRIVTATINVTDGCPIMGTGTSCSYSYGPTNNYYSYGYYQYIYDLSTYSASGEISSIGFQYCYTTAMTAKDNVNIYMGLTSDATFASTTGWIPLTDLTLVYSGPLNCTAQGWNTFTLDNPFYFENGQYLVVAIDDNSGDSDGSSYTYYYSSRSSSTSLYYYNSSTNPDPSSPPTGTLSSYAPNMKFCIEACTPRTLTFANTTVNLTSCANSSQIPTISPVAGGTITYTSSNPAVATVSSSGVVTPISSGTTVITARVGTYNDYCSASGSYTVNVDVTGTSHTLTYNTTANCSGTASTAPASVTGTSAIVTSTSPTCTDMYFIGWNTAADGSGASYSAGSTVDMACSNVTLYAQYSTTPPTISGSSSCDNAMAFCATNDMASYNLAITATEDDTIGGIGSFLQNSPTWWFLRISESGPVNMTIHSSCGDVDFGCWGPFENVTCDRDNDLTNGAAGTEYYYYSGANLATYYGSEYNGTSPTGPSTVTAGTPINGTYALAEPCGNLVDYGGSTSHDEYLQIQNAQEGEIYILVVANFSSCTGTITMDQTNISESGAGQLDCSIVNDCVITNVSTTEGDCDANQTFSVSGNITFTDAPLDGTLTISDGSVSQTFYPPFSSPTAYTLSGLTGDGQEHTITAAFSTSSVNCSKIAYITAPTCEVNCPDATVAMTGYTEIIDNIYYYDVCLGSGVNMAGTQSGYTSPTWTWSVNPHHGVAPTVFSAQSISYTPADEQGYDVSLTVAEGNCRTIAHGRIRVSDGPQASVSSVDLGTICVGNTSTVTIGGEGSAIVVSDTTYDIESVLGQAGETFIPDGPNCTEQCYTSSVTFYDYEEGATVTSAEDIEYLRINMEHSFIGDVQIKLTCPSGRSAVILQDLYSSDTSNTTLYNSQAIDAYTYSWPSMAVDTVWRVGTSSTTYYTGDYLLGRSYPYDQNTGYYYSTTGYTYYLLAFSTAAEAYDFIDNYLSIYYSGHTYTVSYYSTGGYYAISYTSGDYTYYVWLTRNTTTDSDDAYSFASEEAAQDFIDNVLGGSGVVSYTLEETAYNRIYFGEPDVYDIEDGSSLTSTEICDGTDEHNLAGIGYDYAWTNNSDYTTVGYVYNLANLSSSTNVYNNGTQATNTLYHVLPSDVESGSQIYQPYQSFSNLIGCPLNGTWTISVCDSWAKDNGYIFNWELALDPSLLPNDWSYVVGLERVTVDCGSMVSVSGNDVVVTPESGSTMPNNCNITLRDHYGCTTVVPLTFAVTEPIISLNAGSDNDQEVCEDMAIDDIVYTLGGSAINATATGLPAGVAVVVEGTTATITGIPSEPATYNYTITTDSGNGSGCDEKTLTGRLVVNVGNIVPEFDQAGPYCEGTTVNDLPTTSNNGITGRWTPAITNSTNTYTFTPDAGQCATITTMLVTVNPLPTLVYTSGSETLCNNVAPTENIVFTFGGGANGADVTGLPAGMVFNIVGSTVVISGTPTVSGTFPYVVTTTGAVAPCVNESLTRTITVNETPTLVLTSGGSDQTVCEGTAITSLVYTYGGGATGADATLPAGLTSDLNTTAHTLTISGTPTESGTITVVTTGVNDPCVDITLTATVTVNELPELQLVSASADADLCREVPWASNIQYSFGGSATGVDLTALNNSLPTGVTATTSGSTVTISGSPTCDAGSYTYTITTVGAVSPCENISLSGTIQVSENATLTLTSGSDDQSICIPGDMEDIVYTFGGGATNVDITTLNAGLPDGVSASVNLVSQTVTISGSPTVTGTFEYTVTTVGSIDPCKSETVTGNIVVNQLPVLTVAGNDNQSFCLGNAMTDLVFNYSGGATGATVVGTLPAGVTSDLNTTARTLTLSGTPTESGTFSFNVSTQGAAGACTDVTLPATITIYDNPVVEINASETQICNGSNVTLTSNPATFDSYSWSCTSTSDATYTITSGMPATTTGSSISVNPTVTPGNTAVSYSLEVTDANGCTSDATTSINVSDIPTADVAVSPNTKCETPYNGTITVSNFDGALTGTNYIVKVGSSSQTSTGADVLFENLEPGTYVVRITSESNADICYTETTVTIEDEPTSPTVDIAGSLSICDNTSTTLTAHADNGYGTYQYLWSDNSTGQSLVTPNLNQSTNYSVTVTDENECSVQKEVTVVIGNTPEVSASATTPICLGKNSILAASVSNAGNNYTLEWAANPSADAGLTTTSGDRITVTPTVDGTFEYTVTLRTTSCGNGDEYIVSDNVSVVVNPLPTPDITNTAGTTTLTCAVTEIPLIATGGTSYEWSDGVGRAENTITSTGTYVVTVTDANTCSATTQIVIDNDIAEPDVAITQPASTVLTCDVTSIDLQATSATAGTTLDWTTMNVTEPNTYSVVATGPNGCTNTASIQITRNVTPPTVSINNPATTTLTCANPTITLTAYGTGTLSWTTLDVTTPDVYEVVATATNGCTASANITIDIDNAAPTMSIQSSGDILSCRVQSVTLTASGARSYRWDDANSSAGATLNVSTSGTYTVTGTATNGCTAETSYTIYPDYDLPDVSIDAPTTVLNCTDVSIALTANSTTTGTTFDWTTRRVSEPGTYSVVATGPNGCTNTTSITITQDVALPDVSILAPDTMLTCTNNLITLSSSGTGTLSWTTLDVTAPGTYDLIARGDNGCTATTSIVIYQDIVAPHVEIGNNTGTTVLTCDEQSISVSLVDDSEADIYTWSGGENNTGTGNAFTTPGTYTVTATAPNGCTSTASIDITQDIEPPTVSITNNTGTETLTCDITEISVTAVGSATVDSYQWSQGTTQTTANNTLVTIGTYVVTATASNGCTATARIVIDESVVRPDISFVNQTGTTVLTCDVTSIQVTATGAASEYHWSAGNTPDAATNTFTQIGTYYVTAVGSNGCTNTKPFSITENIVPPTVSITNESGYNEINCNFTLVNVTANGSGESYIWSDGTNTAANTFTLPGTYTVTSTAANGCTNSASVVITEDHNPPSPSILSTNGIYTIDCAHPSLILNASGGVSYLWSEGQTTSEITVSNAGTYTVVATGGNGCTASAQVQIGIDTEPPAVAINNVTGETQLNCNVENIHIIAQGGYLYAWSNATWGGGVEQNITTSGVYSVTVTARNGCTNSASITITSDTIPPTLQANSTTGFYELNCNISQIVVEATGNGISYSWSGGTNPTGNTNVFTSAGIYSVTSTGFNGCTSSVAVQQITSNYDAPTLAINDNLGNPVQIVNLNCTNPQATVSVQSDGISYVWNDGETSSSRVLTSQGVYSVTATGSNGCTAATSVEVREDFAEPAAQIINNTGATELNCVTVSISLTANGGSGATYMWSNGSTNRTLTVNAPGTYGVTVTGSNGCTNENSVEITQAPVFNAEISSVGTISCNGGSTSATVTAQGGNPGYFYTWSDGQSTATANNLVAGAYTVTVRDNGGCSAILSCNITQPQPLNVPLIAHDLYCGVSLGSIDAPVTGGTQPYSYMWSNGSTASSLSNINVGSYSLSVTDANNCLATATASIRMLGMLAVNASVTQAVSCNGANDGVVTATCENGAAPMMYSWSTGHTMYEVGNMFAGSYQVTVTDAWGCSGQTSVTLVDPAAMVVEMTPVSPRCYNTSDGRVVVMATGGVSPYSYLWNNSSTEQTLSNVSSGNYSLTITDNAGCTTSRNVTIEAPEEINIEVVTTDVKCYGEKTGKIELSANGGTEPYRYSVERVLELSTSSLFNDIKAGYYNVRVTDVNGCEASSSAIIRQPEEMKIDAVAEDPFCKNSRTGTINVSVIGGVAPYQYYWDNYMSDSSLMMNIPEGQYTVGVVDANGCHSLDVKVTLVDVDVDCLRIPNVFTPNGDGVNDEWIIANIGMFPDAQIYVFNRWGQLMFKTTGDGERWDGSYRGHYVPAGTYIYVIDLFNDDEPYKGTVTILY